MRPIEAPPTFQGWKRPSGALGIRRHFLVIPSVVCAAQAARTAAEGAPGAVAIEHQHGCAQLGGDAHLTEQVLAGLGTHPNVAGTLVVSLGCETVQGAALHRSIAGRGQRAEFVGIQQSGGGIEAAWLGIPPAQARVFSEVIDRLLRAGATVMQAVSAGRDGPDPRWQQSARGSAGVVPREATALPYAMPPAGRGAFFMEAPRSRIAQKPGLAAAGAHIILS